MLKRDFYNLDVCIRIPFAELLTGKRSILCTADLYEVRERKGPPPRGKFDKKSLLRMFTAIGRKK